MQRDTASKSVDRDSLLSHPYFPGTAFLVVGGAAATFGFRYGIKRANELAASDEALAEGTKVHGRAVATSHKGVAATVTPRSSESRAGSDPMRFVRPRAPAKVQPTRVAVRALLLQSALAPTLDQEIETSDAE